MAKLEDSNMPEGINPSKVNGLIKWLVELERENDKTRKLTDAEMIQRIGKRIQDDVKCL